MDAILTCVQDFKSATSAVASKAMRNELNEMIHGIEDPAARKVRVRTASFCRLAHCAGVRVRDVVVLQPVQPLPL